MSTDTTREIRIRRLRATARAATTLGREEHADYCEALAQQLEMGAPVEDEHYSACLLGVVA